MKKRHKIIIALLLVFIAITWGLIIIFKDRDTEIDLTKDADSIIECVENDKNGNYDFDGKYLIYSKDGVVLIVKTEEKLSSKSKETLKFQKDIIEVMYEASNELYGGYTIDLKEGKNSASFKVDIDYTKMDIKKYLEDQIALKKYVKNDGIKTEGVQLYYESRGAICKEK